MSHPILVALTLLASPPEAHTIVHRANLAAYYAGRDGRARVKMRITDGRGRIRERSFAIIRRDVSDEPTDTKDQTYYLLFQSPPDVAKTAYLVSKHVDRDDDRWLYIPALDLVRRIAASDERTSFVGSDFFYEDVSGRGEDEDEHTLIKTTSNYYVLDSVPKDPSAVEFARYRTWIHTGTYLPIKVDYFNPAGKVIRRYTALEVETISGRPTVVRAQMEDLRTGGRTELMYSQVAYDLGLPKKIFTERHLRRPPVKFLP